MQNPFRYFNSSPEVIRLAMMMYIRYPLSLRQIEDLLFERGIDIRHETVRFWWNRFGQIFAVTGRDRLLILAVSLCRVRSNSLILRDHIQLKMRQRRVALSE